MEVNRGGDWIDLKYTGISSVSVSVSDGDGDGDGAVGDRAGAGKGDERTRKDGDMEGKKQGMIFDELPPPRQVSPSAPRFKVDEVEKYVEWMDFSFFIT